MSQDLNIVNAAVDAALPIALTELAEMIAIPSVAAKSDSPMAEGAAKVAELLINKLQLVTKRIHLSRRTHDVSVVDHQNVGLDPLEQELLDVIPKGRDRRGACRVLLDDQTS